MPKLKRMETDTGERSVPFMQAMDDDTNDFEVLRCHEKRLMVCVDGEESSKVSAPAPASVPTVITSTSTVVFGAVADVTGSVGVMLFNGSGDLDPRWPVLPTLPLPLPLRFPNGLSIRALTGVTSVNLYLVHITVT